MRCMTVYCESAGSIILPSCLYQDGTTVRVCQDLFAHDGCLMLTKATLRP